MKTLRKKVLYGTDTLVQKGDEFYQIELSEDPDFEGCSFQVTTFRGIAGSPPPHPENSQSFQTLELATDTFDNIARELETKGLRQYNPAVHGPDKPF